MRYRLLGLATLMLAAVALQDATAQERYPSRSIKFIVPFAAGSATDTLARLLGNHVGASLGQSVIIENTAGGSGVPAAMNVVRAAPDGYTRCSSPPTPRMRRTRACSSACPMTR